MVMTNDGVETAAQGFHLLDLPGANRRLKPTISSGRFPRSSARA